MKRKMGIGIVQEPWAEFLGIHIFLERMENVIMNAIKMDSTVADSCFFL